jgi:hypothetical protein
MTPAQQTAIEAVFGRALTATEATAITPSVDARNDAAVATYLSGLRPKKLAPTEIGNGSILDTMGLAVGNALLDAIHGNASYKYVVTLLDQGRLRLDSALVQGTLTAMVGQPLSTAMTLAQPSVDALNALALVADPVTTNQISDALNGA